MVIPALTKLQLNNLEQLIPALRNTSHYKTSLVMDEVLSTVSFIMNGPLPERRPS